MTNAPEAAEGTLIGQTVSRFCPCCLEHVRKGFAPGPGARPGAKCPRCRSLERHRFFAVLLGALSPQLTDLGVLLDIAPAPQARKPLLELEPRTYVRVDIAAQRGVDLRGDITALPLADRCVDLLVCYHVLEHIPDDAAAMGELVRVLADDGLGILQVPWRPGTTTDEDPEAPEEERIRRFGLADHVRYYGDDFEDRLVAAGLDVVRVTPHEFLGVEAAAFFGLRHDEAVWLVSRAGSEHHAAQAAVARTPTPLTGSFDAVIEELARTRLERRDARAEVKRLQEEAQRLREAAGDAAPRGIGRVLRRR